MYPQTGLEAHEATIIAYNNNMESEDDEEEILLLVGYLHSRAARHEKKSKKKTRKVCLNTRNHLYEKDSWRVPSVDPRTIEGYHSISTVCPVIRASMRATIQE